MKISEIRREDITQEVVDKIISQGTDEHKVCGDVILVLGGPLAEIRDERVPKAAEMFHAKRAPKIIVTGFPVMETEYGSISEALYMKNLLLKRDVPPADIIVEEDAKNTLENFVYSVVAMHLSFGIPNIKKVLLVTSAYHMKRALLIGEQILPKWMKIYPCIADEVKNFTKAKKEVLFLARHVAKGLIPDFEI